MTTREAVTFAAELMRASRRVTLSRPALDRFQDARLAEVLAAAQRTKLYGGRPLRALADAEPMTKDRHRGFLADTVVDPRVTAAALHSHIRTAEPGALFADAYIVATTSGTTGHVGVFFDDAQGWAKQRAIVFSRMFRGLLRPHGFALLAARRYRLAFVIGVGGHTLSSILASRVPRLGQVFADSRVFSIEVKLEQTVRELNTFAPHLLHTYATLLEVLCAQKQAGLLHISPEIITCGSEPVTPQVRAAVRAQFPRARFIETYAATECVAMATACPHGVLHINEDACIIEPVDDALRPVAEGARAERVLVTNLHNVHQPIVRYELTDCVVVSSQPCLCGTSFKTITVDGRTDDTFYLVDDHQRVQVHTPIPLELTLLGIDGLLQYQLVHERQNQLRLLMVVDAHADAGRVFGAVDARVLGYLVEHGLVQAVSFTIEQVAAIARHARSKKLRQITSLVAKPNGNVIAAAAVRAAR